MLHWKEYRKAGAAAGQSFRHMADFYKIETIHLKYPALHRLQWISILCQYKSRPLAGTALFFSPDVRETWLLFYKDGAGSWLGDCTLKGNIIRVKDHPLQNPIDWFRWLHSWPGSWVEHRYYWVNGSLPALYGLIGTGHADYWLPDWVSIPGRARYYGARTLTVLHTFVMHPSSVWSGCTAKTS